MADRRTNERMNTVVVGGGQAGLSVGHHLARRGVEFVILDAGARVGDTWRCRWDSLRLFTPARHSSLDGMPFPGPPFSFPTKDEMADYLEAYARHFALPVRQGMRVDRLSRLGDGFVVVAGDARFEAENVVVAMGNYQRPRVPAFADELDPGIVQLHSFAYRTPRSCGAATCSSSAPATRAPRSRWSWPGGTGHLARRARDRPRPLSRRRSRRAPGAEPPRAAGALPPCPVRPHAHRAAGPPEDAAPGGAAHSHEAEGPRGSGRRPRPARRGGAGRPSAARGRPRPRAGERRLVHGLRSGLLVDRPAGVRPGRRAAPRGWDRAPRSRGSSSWGCTSCTRSRPR